MCVCVRACTFVSVSVSVCGGVVLLPCNEPCGLAPIVRRPYTCVCARLRVGNCLCCQACGTQLAHVLSCMFPLRAYMRSACRPGGTSKVSRLDHCVSSALGPFYGTVGTFCQGWLPKGERHAPKLCLNAVLKCSSVCHCVCVCVSSQVAPVTSGTVGLSALALCNSDFEPV